MAGLQCFFSVPWVITQTKQTDHPSTKKEEEKNSRIPIFFDESKKYDHAFLKCFLLSHLVLKTLPHS